MNFLYVYSPQRIRKKSVFLEYLCLGAFCNESKFIFLKSTNDEVVTGLKYCVLPFIYFKMECNKWS
jgi:hypothetical protein